MTPQSLSTVQNILFNLSSHLPHESIDNSVRAKFQRHQDLVDAHRRGSHQGAVGASLVQGHVDQEVRDSASLSFGLSM